MKYDLVIKNGTLIDPAQGIHAQKDIAFSDGCVLKVSRQKLEPIVVIKGGKIYRQRDKQN